MQPPETPPAQLVFQVGAGYILSSAMHAAIEIGVADQLASGPKTVSELAHGSALRGVQEDALYRLLRALASAGVFEELEPKRFRNTPASECLRSDVQGTVRNLLRWLTDPFHFRVYAEMLYSVTTGRPAAEKVTGGPVFEYFPKHPELSELFNNAMTEFSAAVIPAVLDAYDFGDIDLLADIAGGHGMVLTSILQKYPRMRGILFDLDHVIAGAKPRLAALGLDDRCQAMAGDFFKQIPHGPDAYVMKHIIHDWEDEPATALLQNIRRALDGKDKGRVILIESVLPPGNQPDLGKVIDLEMMTVPGGRERTADEFRDLFARAGFTRTKIVSTKSPVSVIEARV
jgi:hypothetical protein